MSEALRSSGQTVEEAAGSEEIGEALFFFAEFAGVGNEAAAGTAGGMLDVKHLMEEDVFDDEAGDFRAIHATIEKNLIGAGIITAKLAAPGARAPTNVRTAELGIEKNAIEFVKELVQIKVPACRTGGGADAIAAKAVDAVARAMGAGVFEIGSDEFRGSMAAINAREKKCGGGFQNVKGRALQEIGKADEEKVLSAADGQNEAGVGIKGHAEARRTAMAAEAGEDALEERGASGDERGGGGASHVSVCA